MDTVTLFTLESDAASVDLDEAVSFYYAAWKSGELWKLPTYHLDIAAELLDLSPASHLH
jgi:hypothetical protein